MKFPAPLAKGPDFPDLGAFPTRGVPPCWFRQVGETGTFGSNPGRLRMVTYSPQGGAAPHAPLVVLLHGCGQVAADFAEASGWISLADELGFTLILPEQSGRNHQGRCFQWFQPEHTARDGGEALSIRQMVKTGIGQFDADPNRVFVVGLSAGGAMAAALLAAYPEVFAAGAVVAGLPVGAATSTVLALIRMAHAGPERTPMEWGEQVRHAGGDGDRRSWPRISIWHGSSDTVVDAGNADLLAIQWATVHGLSPAPSADFAESGVHYRTWKKGGAAAVEQWLIPGMAHGYPINSTAGSAGPYIVDAEISATRQIARFWGLL